MRQVSIVLALLALALPAIAADDPWVGRTRDEVVVALGEPSKAKVAKDGSGRLTYKFHRIREGSVPGPRMIPVTVDGVGTVFRILPREEGDLHFEPTSIDDDGNPVAGGVRRDPGGSTSFDPKTREFEKSWDPADDVEVAGSVKLTFEFGADGRVASWSVSPKSARRDPASN